MQTPTRQTTIGQKLNEVAFEYLQYNELINDNVCLINIVFVSLIALET